MVKDHVREHGSLLASVEKQLLVAIARRLPAWVTSDGLTLLAFAAMCTAGAGFALAQFDVRALALVVLGLAANWFGDSLDGTLARVRKAERPRYGYYVDHVVDIVGTSALLAGLAFSPFMAAPLALAVLVMYLMVTSEIFLATAVHGTFRLSFAWVGPTELRILLAIGTLALAADPHVDLGGFGEYRLFDVGGVIAIAGMAVALAGGVLRNVRLLSRLEPPKQLAA